MSTLKQSDTLSWRDFLIRAALVIVSVTVIVITHNSAIAPTADRVITVKNSRIESVRLNPSPVDISQIEW
jgi:ABC-type lipoprotein export system ATPase subunit